MDSSEIAKLALTSKFLYNEEIINQRKEIERLKNRLANITVYMLVNEYEHTLTFYTSKELAENDRLLIIEDNKVIDSIYGLQQDRYDEFIFIKEIKLDFS